MEHEQQRWIRLKPDLLICHGEQRLVVLDTKWKLLDADRNNGSDKYGLAQSDFYQLHAYGQTYLQARGDVARVYPPGCAIPPAAARVQISAQGCVCGPCRFAWIPKRCCCPMTRVSQPVFAQGISRRRLLEVRPGRLLHRMAASARPAAVLPGTAATVGSGRNG